MERRRGRGRGRGRGVGENNLDQQHNAWGTNGKCVAEQTPMSAAEVDDGAKRFEDACAKISSNVQNFIRNDMESSSEEDDELEENKETILKKMVSSYAGGDTGANDLGRTQQFLLDSFKSGATVCLVCIETIKKVESIWSCENCYGVFHLPCIQKWSKDSVYHQVEALQDDSVKKSDITWFCPKCRQEYQQSRMPTKYLCFCGKERDPKLDLWLAPHTCGQTCGRALKPECGHCCLLLCHPGPCPPCPKTVQVKCYCGAHQPVTKRCSAREWSCGKPCGHKLTCNQHKCNQPCHAGDCDPCPRRSVQACQCRAKKSERPCASPKWNCEKVCGNTLDCSFHTCALVCHSGDCGPCPLTGERTCPCGKSKYSLPCTQEIPNCGDTCGKHLDCGVHLCSQRCHTGPCGMCLQMRVMRCRCGYREKSIPCYKVYTCETKCKKLRDCGRHPCNRKCCDGDCPPCEQPCGRTLGCRNHKCSSRCHQGLCYPCPLTVSISCNCGVMTTTVPCGREKSTKPPKCKALCSAPPDCHHPERKAHACHFGACPPCRQPCLKQLLNCSHRCPVKCHAAVVVKIESNQKRLGPWEPKPMPKIETVNKPCPSCQVPMPVTCIGGHETIDVHCSNVKPYSCLRTCGRQLVCGNHKCQLLCHKVANGLDGITAGKECVLCEKACERVRPTGCTHMCLKACHPDDCPPCHQMVKIQCHCNLNILYVECSSWIVAEGDVKDGMKSCQNQCPKSLDCNHRCPLKCHSGPCPSAGVCKKKVIIRCPCKRLKKEFGCNAVYSGHAGVECDAMCKQLKDSVIKAKEEEEARKKEEEERKAQEELEKYQRKMDGKKRRQRKTKENSSEEKSTLRNISKYLLISLGFALVAVFAYSLLRK